MQYEIFTIPVRESAVEAEKLNRFLRGHKVVQVDKEVVKVGDETYWSFCICYLDGVSSGHPSVPSYALPSEKKSKVDYREVLSDEQFKRFLKLRELRKKIAEEDAVPAYAVFTDAELAVLAQAEELTEQVMLKIDGIGKKRVEKYGAEMVRRYNETGG